MNSLLAYATAQYGFIKESRNLLFSYCSTFSPQDFVREHPSFGNGGSVRSILVHVANTYESWIAQRGLNRDIRFTDVIRFCISMISVHFLTRWITMYMPS